MPTVFPLIPDSKQTFHDDNGVLAIGYKLWVYEAGSSTKATSYTESDGLTANSNPIVLNSRGEVPNGVYVATGSYKLVLAPGTESDPPSTPTWTRDNLTPYNDTQAATVSQWEASGLTPTFVSVTSFTLAGDQRTDFHEGRRIQTQNTAGTVYSEITDVSYSDPETTVTVRNDGSSVLDSGLDQVNLSLLTATNHAVPTYTNFAWRPFGSPLTISSATSYAEITGLDTRGYEHLFLITNLTASNSTSGAFKWELTNDNGSTWTTASNGFERSYFSFGTSTANGAGSTTGGAMSFSAMNTTIPARIEARLSDCNGGAVVVPIMFSDVYAWNGSTAFSEIVRSHYGAVYDANGIRFYFASVDIATAQIDVYRRKVNGS